MYMLVLFAQQPYVSRMTTCQLITRQWVYRSVLSYTYLFQQHKKQARLYSILSLPLSPLHVCRPRDVLFGVLILSSSSYLNNVLLEPKGLVQVHSMSPDIYLSSHVA
jgi:hypothetical protein